MALQVLPDPRGLDWQTWVDTVWGFNPEIRNKVSPDDPWQQFALRLVQYEPLTPLPESFDTWQGWAVALKLVLSPD